VLSEHVFGGGRSKRFAELTLEEHRIIPPGGSLL
jgi:hypothetical protein